jgi:hypothetical protein
MSGRIRIDRTELTSLPDPPQVPSSRHGGIPGEVFGTVAGAPSHSSPGAVSVWLNPKLLYPLAGLAAAITCSIFTDGIAGFGRSEAAGKEPNIAAVLFSLPLFVALLTMFIAAVDDLASGAVGRALIFAAIGLLLGSISGLIATLAGGVCMALGQRLLFGNLAGFPDESTVLVLGMVVRTPAWIVAGALGGAAICALGRSWRRVLLGAIGGAIGGFVGGILFDPISFAGFKLGARSATVSRLVGLCVIGVVTGLAIAFAESAAKRVWLAIEQGRLIGKQFILYRSPTSIGAAYANDVFLFKDPSVQQRHAQIVKRGGGWIIEALPGALVRVNSQPVSSRSISDGDVIQIGETALRFNARAS